MYVSTTLQICGCHQIINILAFNIFNILLIVSDKNGVEGNV